MFGYILPDKPNMYVKDYTLYRAHYCGLCKSTKKYYGNLMRFSVNYDTTFIDIMLRGLSGKKAVIGEGVCILNPLQKKPYVVQDEISERTTHLNVLLADFKARDDIADAPSAKKRLVKLFLSRKVSRARAALSAVASILDDAYIAQQEIERVRSDSFDRAADPFAVAIAKIFETLLGEKYTENIGIIAYNLAKFVYVMDAVDDFESDIKSGQYNVFGQMYPDKRSKRELLDEAEPELEQLLNGIIASIKEAYENVSITVNEGVVTNTLWYGLRARARAVINKECTKKCQRIRF